jgi:hypothetical protein
VLIPRWCPSVLVPWLSSEKDNKDCKDIEEDLSPNAPNPLFKKGFRDCGSFD